jgi:tetratricopeptide (TPR) repeat protein
MQEAQKALELNPENAVAWYVTGQAYEMNGRYEDAIAAHEKMAALNPARRWALGITYVSAGQPEEARKILAELKAHQKSSFDALGLAALYTALGDKDEAFHWLAYEPPHAFLPWVRIGRRWAPLRDDPRYLELLRRMNLPH